MQLVFSTAEFQVHGVSYPGFPIVLDEHMRSEREANQFLRYYLIHRGRVRSKRTWATYGYHVLDYFACLKEMKLDWRSVQACGEPTVVAVYRDQLCRTGIRARTINQRLSTIVQFYKRDVWMPSALMRSLWDYKIHVRSRTQIKCEERAPLFVRSNGLPWSDDGRGFTAIIRRAATRSGFDAWPHVLRHTYASYTLAALQRQSKGIDPLVFVQRQLGHSSIHTTMEYLHLVDAVVERVVSSYDEDVSTWSEA